MSPPISKKIHAKAWIFFIQNKSNVKQEVHYVAIFNDVIFSFSSHSGCLLRSLLNLTLNKLSVYP